jgi:hypothetical protein
LRSHLPRKLRITLSCTCTQASESRNAASFTALVRTGLEVVPPTRAVAGDEVRSMTALTTWPA